MRPRRQSPVHAGTILSKALALVGITEDRVSAVLGRPCRCRQRAKRMNELSDWAWTVLRGRPSDVQLTPEQRAAAEEQFARIEGR